MLQSMTGFGKAVGSYKNKTINIEIKSLNSKHLDLNLRIPSFYREKELELRSYLSKSIQRGKVDFSLFVEIPETDKAQKINKSVVFSYYHDLKVIAHELDIQSNDKLLSLAIKMPDTLSQVREDLDENEWQMILVLIDEAIEKFVDFRKTEGESLHKELTFRIARILTLLDAVIPFEEERIETVKARINKNLEQHITNAQKDDNRFEQELIYYIEKLDITEEKVRLKAHCEHFLDVIENEEKQGKKLGFIGQEIGREVNTLGSKANHQEIQKLVVQMKDELEKLKEQILNIQ